MDYVKMIHSIIDDIVDNKDGVLIREIPEENGKDKTILVACDREDVSRLIGRHGSTAKAIREVINIAAKLDETHVHLKFESFEEDEEEA